ncbi:MAG: substrate-binding domain-containing protein [Pseudomonadota bacterium]
MNLKELAHTLGLSQTTVSRALNGYPEVSETTRRRVLQAAEQHNYRPNTRAKALATGRAMTIGHVIPVSTKHEMVNPVFADFISGAAEVYAAHGYDITMSVVKDADEAGAYRTLAAKSAVDGVIVHAPTTDEPRIALLTELGLPFVVHGRASQVTLPYSWLDVNNRRGFQRATEFLVDLGHHRIGLINGLEHLDFAIRRRQGYLAGLAQCGLQPDAALMTTGEMTESYGYLAAGRMIDAPHPPTAFLASSIIVALGARRAIEERGLVMGRDISIIAHDDDLSYFRNDETEPMFTALRSSVKEAGHRTATMLLAKISGTDQTPQQQLMEVEMILGRSTGPAPIGLARERQRS